MRSFKDYEPQFESSIYFLIDQTTTYGYQLQLLTSPTRNLEDIENFISDYLNSKADHKYLMGDTRRNKGQDPKGFSVTNITIYYDNPEIAPIRTQDFILMEYFLDK